MHYTLLMHRIDYVYGLQIPCYTVSNGLWSEWGTYDHVGDFVRGDMKVRVLAKPTLEWWEVDTKQTVRDFADYYRSFQLWRE